MDKYLSIGEVAKLKGVSVKSLRYYGELGILPPAYINKETGYRYYTMKQLIIVDLICFCVGLDIPLKNFHSYIKENSTLDVEKIIYDGQAVAKLKIENLRIALGKLDSIAEHLSVSQEIKKFEGLYTRTFSERFFLVTQWDEDHADIHYFIESITKLYKLSEQHHLTSLYNQGILRCYHNNVIQNFVSLEVVKPSLLINDILTIPKGEYRCEYFSNENILIAAEKYSKETHYPDGSIVLAQEIYDARMDIQPTSPIEVQVLIP